MYVLPFHVSRTRQTISPTLLPGDGLRHFGYQDCAKFYNGATIEDIHAAGSTINGIGAWSEQGIVGRGILLDYESWRQTQRLSHDAFSAGSIPLDHLKAVAEWEGVEIKFGDILIIRSGIPFPIPAKSTIATNVTTLGYTSQYTTKTHAEIQALSKINPPPYFGVEQSTEMLHWIWSNFSAVAADHPSFECWPSTKPYMLHEILLAGWGCPIGELFDLEKLSEYCRDVGRWSFFVASEVCNVSFSSFLLDLLIEWI